MAYSITAYTDLYGLIRHVAGDIGVYDNNGALTGQYKYQNAVIANGITYNLLKMKSSFSKVSGSDTITPAMTDENDIGYLVNLVALDLVLSDAITSYRTRNLSVAKDLSSLAIKIALDLKRFGNAYGMALEVDGAMAHLADEADRWTNFVTQNF
ncbi:MAG: hypothetical protein PHN44_10830 [Candidatus Marinimicrobia bacterium]|jgi:hypothetical protein|nr:hypothetical protein [Candidatus Neomarinimicrobiota bacterium]MDD5539918.1 hypothetical protein [Candidatus Neomarinimicrobiota bacterium]